MLQESLVRIQTEPTVGGALTLVLRQLRGSSTLVANRLLHYAIGGPLGLFYLFTELAIVLIGLFVLLTGGANESLIRVLIRGVLLWGAAAWMLQDYGSLTRAFNGGFDVVANVVLGAKVAWPTHWSSTLLGAATHSFLGAVGKLWQALPIFHINQELRGGLVGIGPDLIMLLDAFVASFLMGLVVLILAVAYIAFAGVFFMGVALTAIGVAVGPLLVPCLILPYLSELFHGWFRFLLTAGLYKVVAAVVLILAAILLASSIAEVNALALALARGTARHSSLWSSAEIFVYVFYLLIVATFVLLLLRQIPSIVNHLMSGRGTSGTGTWLAMGQGARSIGERWNVSRDLE
ncbi:MAG: type IV secretion system protein [Gammaproteobacteria bacterium]